MKWLRAYGLALLIGISHFSAAQQKAAKPNKPVCSARAICFSGEVSAGLEFRRTIDDQLDFVLSPANPGWKIQILPRTSDGDCNDFAAVVTGPFRYHSDLDIDMSYDTPAENEVSDSPRHFSFVTNCKDYRKESARLKTELWPYSFTEKEIDKAAAENGSPEGTGRLWITGSRINHASDTTDDKVGTIDWMRFTVETRLPARVNPKSPPAKP